MTEIYRRTSTVRGRLSTVARALAATLGIGLAGCGSLGGQLSADNASPINPCTALSDETVRAIVGDQIGQPTGTQMLILRECTWEGPKGSLKLVVLPRSSELLNDDNASFNKNTYVASDAQAVDVKDAERAVIVPHVYPVDPQHPGATLAATFKESEIALSFTTTKEDAMAVLRQAAGTLHVSS